MASEEESTAPLPQDMASLFNSSLYSDIDVRCSDESTYPAHKAVICTQSPVLADACNPNHAFKEAKENVIALKDDDPDHVHALLKFLYHRDYTTPTGGDDDVDDPAALVFHASMYAMGEYYQIPALKALAQQRFRTAVFDHAGWKDAAFLEAVEYIYEATPDEDRGLRDLVVAVSHKHFREQKDDKRFEEVAHRFGHFAMDVAKMLHEHVGAVMKGYAECKDCAGLMEMDLTSWNAECNEVQCSNCGCWYKLSMWLSSWRRSGDAA